MCVLVLLMHLLVTLPAWKVLFLVIKSRCWAYLACSWTCSPSSLYASAWKLVRIISIAKTRSFDLQMNVSRLFSMTCMCVLLHFILIGWEHVEAWSGLFSVFEKKKKDYFLFSITSAAFASVQCMHRRLTSWNHACDWCGRNYQLRDQASMLWIAMDHPCVVQRPSFSFE